MHQTRLPSVPMVLLSSLLSATLAVLGLSLVTDRAFDLSPPAGTAAAPATAERTYQVRRGDSLSRIARRELGATRRWRELYAANRDRLRRPSEIEVGMTLRLP